MAKGKILLVEDDDDIAELVKHNLTREGWRVERASSGEMGFTMSRTFKPDLILLDLMLPGIDGLEICKMLKHDIVTADTPIIMLTAKGEEADVVTGLEVGADDYITKPFSVRELIARIKAVLRRKAIREVEEMQTVKLDDLEIHPGKFEVLVKGKPVELTRGEFRLLHLLASKPGWVFSRSKIIEEIKGDDYPVTERSVDVQIVGLRKKLGAVGRKIETIRGVGYRFKD